MSPQNPFGWLSLLAAALTVAASGVCAQAPAGNPVPVTVDNFPRAESDMYAAAISKDAGGVGKLIHRREPATIENQTVIRLNRDTLYTSGVFDLNAGPVTITLPDAGKRYMALQIINEDHYVPAVYYGAGSHTFTEKSVGTRYMFVAIRTLVDPSDPKDIEQVHALQDAIKVDQKELGKLELPNWDSVSQKKVRDALLVLASTEQDFKHAFGTKAQVDPVNHLIGTAAGWGVTPIRTQSTLTLHLSKTTALRPISLASRRCRLTLSGQSVSIMPTASSRKTGSMPTLSTISQPRRTAMERLLFSSVDATARFPIACQS